VTDINKQALLPCPFCGSKELREGVIDNSDFNYANEYYIKCIECGGRTDECSDKEVITKEWNTRTQPSAWQLINTAPMKEYVIINIAPLNYPVIAAQDENGWMTRTGAFYGVGAASFWMHIPKLPVDVKEGE